MGDLRAHSLEVQLDLVENIIERISLENDISYVKVLERIKQKRKEPSLKTIPVSVFKVPNLGVLEAAVKYLHEDESMPFCEIAVVLQRDERVIWVSYQHAKSKAGKKLEFTSKDLMIPCKIFLDNNLGPLESLCSYLKERCKMRYSEIARLVGRSTQVVWNSCSIARRKNGK